MQNWAKRSLKAALFTGGLFMLGTGIATADERFDPDAPPSPLDGGVSVPVKVGNFNVGTPFGEENIPVVVDETISSEDGFAEGSKPFAPYFKNNVLAPNVLAPVEATGWAVAAGGTATNVNDSQESYSQGGDISTSGEGDGLAGNVVAPTAVTPVQATGLAFPLLGSATVTNNTSQDSTAGGNVETDGDNGAGSGNIVAPQVALPVAVNNTAAGWFAGIAKVTGTSEQSAAAPGTLTTSGDDSVLSGNIAGAPGGGVAHVDGTAASWGGIATNTSQNSGSAVAGSSGGAGRAVGDPYAATSGDGSVLGGNAATPQPAPMAIVDCTAGAWVGMSTAECTSDNSTDTGGDVTTSGSESVLGGNIADAPVAAPATVNETAGAWGGMADSTGTDTNAADTGGATSTAGDDSTLGGNIVGAPTAGNASVDCTAGTWIGMVSSECDNTNTAEAGNAAEGEDYATTLGDDSAGGGNIVTAQPAPLAQVDCTSGVWGGMSTTDCVNDSTAVAGGGDETSGDSSTLGGNVVDAAAAVPAEGYSNAGAWIGDAEANGVKTALTDAGGNTDTSGVDSTGGGNIVDPAVSAPTAVDCNAPVWGGESSTSCITDVASDAGGTTHSNGDDSVIGGNTASGPISPVLTGSDTAASFIGDSTTLHENTTTSDAGGDTFTQGDDAVLGGNTGTTAGAGAGEVICTAGTVVGTADCTASNDVETTAGGYTGTTGDGSTGSGNIIETPQAPVAESFGVVGAAAGESSAIYAEDKDVTAGGDSTTNDDNGVVSSNLVTAPGAPAAQVSNIALAVVGSPTSIVDSDLTNTAGGDVSASANDSVGSGNIAETPIALPADVHTLSGAIVGDALAQGVHNTDSTAGGTATTTSEGSPLSGNIAGAQGAGAANVYGWVAGAAANNLAESEKTLSSTAGGDSTTAADGGSLSGNQVLADGNAIAGVFGNAGSLVANDTANTTSVTDVTSGGDAVASGDGGNLAANVVQADAQPLAQVFGINPSAGGNTVNNLDTTTTGTNGGDVTTSGVGGNLAGDIVDADAQAPWQIAGIEAAALGNAMNAVGHETTTTNSGSNATAGDAGNLAGDIVNADAQAPAQIIGWDAAAAGNGTNVVGDSLTATNGGTSDTSGIGGNLAGDIISAEGQAAPQIVGWAASVAGNASQSTTSESVFTNGGNLTTVGDGAPLSGSILDGVVTADPATLGWAATLFGNATNLTDNSLDASNGGTATAAGGEAYQLPIGLAPQVNEISIPIGGTLVNVLTNDSMVTTAGAETLMLGADESLLSADSIPSLPAAQRSDVPAMPGLPVTADMGTVNSGVPGLPSADALALPGTDALALPGAGDLAMPGADALDMPAADAFNVPGMPASSGLKAGMDAAQQGMNNGGRDHGGYPLTPQANLGQTTLPDAGSVSGTLPMGDVEAPMVPAMSGLDSAQLEKLLGEFPMP